jgi:hypothetical protein
MRKEVESERESRKVAEERDKGRLTIMVGGAFAMVLLMMTMRIIF